MQVLLVMLAALFSPLLGLGLLFWLDHLEDTLVRDVAAARRRPAPAPILAIPVSAVPRVPTVGQRPELDGDIPGPRDRMAELRRRGRSVADRPPVPSPSTT